MKTMLRSYFMELGGFVSTLRSGLIVLGSVVVDDDLGYLGPAFTQAASKIQLLTGVYKAAVMHTNCMYT